MENTPLVQQYVWLWRVSVTCRRSGDHKLCMASHQQCWRIDAKRQGKQYRYIFYDIGKSDFMRSAVLHHLVATVAMACEAAISLDDWRLTIGSWRRVGGEVRRVRSSWFLATRHLGPVATHRLVRTGVWHPKYPVLHILAAFQSHPMSLIPVCHQI